MLLLWGSDHILFYNDAFRPSPGNNARHPALLGGKAEEHWGEAWATAKPLIEEVRNTGQGVHRENLPVPIYRNGKLEDAYWTFSYSPVKDEVGKISGVLVICQETTQNVLAQKQSDANKESFQDIARQKEILASLQVQSLVLQRMDEGVSVSNENGCILFTNPAEDKMFGYEAGELIGRNVIVQNAYPPEENEKIVASVINELKTEGFWSGEWHNRKKNGDEFYTYSYITSILVDGKTMFVCVQRDITEEKKREEALKAAKEQLELTFRNIPSGIYHFNKEGKIIYLNERGAILLGYASVEKVLEEKDISQLKKKLDEAFEVLNPESSLEIKLSG
jgi:PAS domain S-box-containing protein